MVKNGLRSEYVRVFQTLSFIASINVYFVCLLDYVDVPLMIKSVTCV